MAANAASTVTESQAVKRLFQRIDADHESFVEQLIELSQIPAPTFAEHARAAYVERRMRDAGLSGVRKDAAGNVFGNVEGEAPALMIAAHLDTVFAADDDHTVTRDGSRLVGRGIGDNSLGLAAMLEIAALSAELDFGRRVVFVATVGEEGLGDLNGVRTAVDEHRDLNAFIAIEGHFLEHVVNVGVGSKRVRISVRGEGGHSWHDYGQPSAIHAAAETVHRILRLELPASPRTTVNVGHIEGGEGINILARHATLDVDMRSESQEALDDLAANVSDIIRDVAVTNNVRMDATPVGDRPVGHIDPNHVLLSAALDSLRNVGVEGQLETASTDANYPASLGIPSVCVGISTGGGMHTPEEWIDEAKIATGLKHLLTMVMLAAEARF